VIGRRVKIIDAQDDWLIGKEGLVVGVYRDGRPIIKLIDGKSLRVVIDEEKITVVKPPRRQRKSPRKKPTVEVRLFGQIAREYRALAERLAKAARESDPQQLLQKTVEFMKKAGIEEASRSRKPRIFDRGLLIRSGDLVLFMKPRKAVFFASIRRGDRWRVYRADAREYVEALI